MSRHERTYLNRAGVGEREPLDHLSDFERELWEWVEMQRSLRSTDFEKRGSDVELNQKVVQIIHLEFCKRLVAEGER
jgi:hypothetical protein